MAKSAECRCESNFTCRYCLSHAKPWLFTPRTNAEVAADEHRKWLQVQKQREIKTPEVK